MMEKILEMMMMSLYLKVMILKLVDLVLDHYLHLYPQSYWVCL